MNNKFLMVILFLVVALGFVAGAIVYPMMPERVASHWNEAGEVNGYMGKFWGIFLLPVIMLAILALYAVIPLIDPLKKNFKDFRKYYDGFWILIEVFLLYIFGLTLAWNLGAKFNFIYALVPALAVLWFLIGIFLKKLKPNWFMGIRTPWTLSNEKVWEKTHKLGGLLFQISAVLVLVSLFFGPVVSFFVVMASAVASGVISLVYSYVIFKKNV